MWRPHSVTSQTFTDGDVLLVAEELDASFATGVCVTAITTEEVSGPLQMSQNHHMERKKSNTKYH